MTQIRTKWYYTDLVEHFLRMAVRYNVVSNPRSQQWIDDTKQWLKTLPGEDKAFIQYVFDKQFFKTSNGLYAVNPSESMLSKRRRLEELERDFAIKTGIIGANECIIRSIE